jgi:hypothetical protein
MTYEKKKKKALAAVPFHPYHIAAIAWIFLPGGSVPRTTADVQGFDAAIAALNPSPAASAAVRDNLNTVFAKLQNFINNNDADNTFGTGRQNFQALLATMDDLWDGADSDMTASLVAQIASLG